MAFDWDARRCDCCGRMKPDTEGYSLHAAPGDDPALFICSPSCLVEYAWMLKDRQTKLSKSTETPT